MTARTDPLSAASLEAYIETALKGLQVQPPGVVVALHYAGQDYIFPFGTGISADTVFGIGSVTKVFTATLLAYECVTKAKSLSDPVTDYLPTAVANSNLQDVTLQMLATHTSSFPRTGGGQAANNLFADQPTSQALLNFWNQWTPAQTPGFCWCYSNVGFVTLGYAVSGMSIPPTAYDYLTVLSEVITGPNAPQLNMLATTTYVNETPSAVTQGHSTNGHPVSTHAPDLYSSGADILTWLKANLAATSGSSTLDQALVCAQQDQNVTQQICPDCQQGSHTETAFSMALAWQISNETPQIWAKDGASGRGGYSCWIGFMPSARIGLAILTNQDGANPGKVGVQIVRHLAAS